MRILRPLVAERHDLEAARLDDRLVLVGVHRADRVDDRPARLHALGRGSAAARAGARAAARRASAGRAAGRGRRGRSTARRRARGRSRRARAAAVVPSASTTVTFVAPSVARFARSSLARFGSSSTAVTSPRSWLVLPPGAAQRSSTRSPSCEPTTRPASCEPRLCGQIRPSATARSSTRSTRIGAGEVGRLGAERRLAAHEPDDRLERLVHRAHQRERVVVAEIALEGLGDPVGIRLLERAVGERVEQRADAFGEPAHDRVRERHRALEPRAAHELDRLVRGRVRRGVRVAELVRAEAERRAHRRIELAHRPLAERVDRVVERAHALHGAVGEPLRERALALVEVASPRCERRGRRTRPARRRAAAPRTRRGAPARPPSAEAAQVLGVRHAPPALRLHLEQLERAVVADARLPDDERAAVDDRRARRCAARARGRGSRARAAGASRSSSRSAGVIFSAYVTPSAGCGSKCGSAMTRSSSRAAISAERVVDGAGVVVGGRRRTPPAPRSARRRAPASCDGS